jgi:kynurenine formamidase
MYNGRSADLCRTADGALEGGVGIAKEGIIGRGVLVDVPMLMGREWLEPKTAISNVDLDRWFERVQLEARPGDILFIRTGRDAWEAAGVAFERNSTGLPGLGVSTLPWLHSHDVAVLVSDVGQGVAPSEVSIPEPIHFISVVAMGMWLVDNADLGSLARVCRERGRYEFMSILVPLALTHATGSPINPIAMF